MTKKWYAMRMETSGKRAIVRIDDEIGAWGVTAGDFYRDLKEVAGDEKAVDVHVNSPGGHVFDGMAIYNMLKSHRGKVTTYVDGIAASMASIIVLAGDTVVMPENAMMMIHKPFGGVLGTADVMRDQAEVLDKITANMVAIYAGKSGQSEDDVLAAMDKTTWMTGAEAYALGYADVLGSPVDLAASFDVGRYASIPENISMRFFGRQKASHENIVSALAGMRQSIDNLNMEF